MPTGQTPAAAASVRRWLNMLIEGRQLSPAQRRVAGFLLDHPEEAVWLSAEELGRRSGVSQPTVSRFASALGFDGYPELREQARAQVQEELRGTGTEADSVSALHRLIAAETANLAELASSPWAGERIERVGSYLADSRPLPVLGLRVSKPFADIFVHFAAKVHPDVRSVPAGSDGDDVLVNARAAGATWLLAFGLPRYPRALQESIQFARTLGLRVALVTDSPLCPLAGEVDDLLAAPVASTLTFDSTVAPMALTMSLLHALTEALPEHGQRWLEEFDQRASDRNLFLD
ncbi:MurR/RpiR family transcriptional regulator [Mycobacterium aquaticum]|uniref:Transcriptional regulator n=1 Tax=Mycobacterium aquaticum TaxID=1927124 RepID=A0A1X0BA04_9MYCO|nr:MurR/RpiR family transcriptional regulator [Mycobacterium aquaticum]ORA39140.1 transcriptional regulator [Mycobacterium aquaticum]